LRDHHKTLQSSFGKCSSAVLTHTVTMINEIQTDLIRKRLILQNLRI